MTQQFKTCLLQGEDGLTKAKALLKEGECIALPTETVYGLAADASNVQAIDKVFVAKGRPKNHPLIVHIPDVTHLKKWAEAIPATAYALAEKFWPGPLTFLLKKAKHVPTEVTGGLDTIALRVPAHPLFLNVLKELNMGLAAPSANRYKQLSPTISAQVMSGLDGRIAAVLEGGACDHGLESTIIDLVSPMTRILRSGPITKQALEQAMQQPVASPQHHVEVVPGNVTAHYQPKTPLQLVDTAQLLPKLTQTDQQNCHFVVWSETAIEQVKATKLNTIQWTQLPHKSADFGSQLYSSLYQIDQSKPALIIFEQPPKTDSWAAVNDRLSRAASQ